MYLLLNSGCFVQFSSAGVPNLWYPIPDDLWWSLSLVRWKSFHGGAKSESSSQVQQSLGLPQGQNMSSAEQVLREVLFKISQLLLLLFPFLHTPFLTSL